MCLYYVNLVEYKYICLSQYDFSRAISCLLKFGSFWGKRVKSFDLSSRLLLSLTTHHNYQPPLDGTLSSSIISMKHSEYRRRYSILPKSNAIGGILWSATLRTCASLSSYLDSDCHHSKHTVVKSTSQSRYIQDSLFSSSRQYRNYIHR